MIARATGIPLSSFAQGEKEKLLHMEEVLTQRVVGQNNAIQAIRYETFDTFIFCLLRLSVCLCVYDVCVVCVCVSNFPLGEHEAGGFHEYACVCCVFMLKISPLLSPKPLALFER